MASILSTGVSALTAFQRQLTTIGHNIANVNTEGYSRQVVDYATREPEITGAGWVGTGVQISDIRRAYDGFLAGQVRSTQSSAGDFEAYHRMSVQLDDLVADPNVGLDPVLQRFFNAMQDLTDDPSSVAARQVVLAEANALSDRFNFLDDRLDTIKSQTNSEIRDSINEINALAQGIADTNMAVIRAGGQAAGKSPNDLLDKREQMLFELSKQISVDIVEQEDGAINVFVGNGQSLVMGTQAGTMGIRSGDPDAADLDITIDYGFGTQVVTRQIAGGSIGGLMRFANGLVDQSQSQLGLVAVGLAERVNAMHALGLDLEGDFGGEFFALPQGSVWPRSDNAGIGTVTFNYADVGKLTTSDYNLVYNGADSYTLTRMSDGVTTAISTGGSYPFTSAEIDGFTLTLSAGASARDSFLVVPTREAAGKMSVSVDQVNDIAAAGALRSGEITDVNGAPINTGSGKISQPLIGNLTGLPLSGSGGDVVLTFSADVDGLGNPGYAVTGGVTDTLLYDPATEGAGKSFTLASGGMTIEMSGNPAVGDTFVIADNTNGTGDNRNAGLIADLQNTKFLLGGSATLQNSYTRMVSNIGAKTSEAGIGAAAQQGLLQSAEDNYKAVSGVNLDEEAAKLIQFQQAYQASAQVISVAQTLFDTLIGAVRR